MDVKAPSRDARGTPEYRQWKRVKFYYGAAKAEKPGGTLEGVLRATPSKRIIFFGSPATHRLACP